MPVSTFWLLERRLVSNMRICIVQPSLSAVSETFIRSHAERLRDVCGVVHSLNGRPAIGDQSVLSQSLPARASRAIARRLRGQNWGAEIDAGYAAAFRQTGADVVLAEYGTVGSRIAEICRRCRIPLVVHFHGYDASKLEVLERLAEPYRQMFDHAAAVIAVSGAMSRKLLTLGCPPDRLVYSPYGIDCKQFRGANPSEADPTFVAVGRFVEKKAPYLTLLAFAQLLESCPEARLRMIGNGPLSGVCEDLARALGITHAVTFLGAQPPEIVRREMQTARAFVQHSITAADGDSEGTPVAVLEAGASGLPVVSTRHAGIPDVVIEGETGLLVDERDVDGMATQMLRLARDPQLAAELGRNAAAHVRRYFTMEQSIGHLQRVLDAAARGQDIRAIRDEIAAELPRPAKPSLPALTQSN